MKVVKKDEVGQPLTPEQLKEIEAIEASKEQKLGEPIQKIEFIQKMTFNFHKNGIKVDYERTPEAKNLRILNHMGIIQSFLADKVNAGFNSPEIIFLLNSVQRDMQSKVEEIASPEVIKAMKGNIEEGGK